MSVTRSVNLASHNFAGAASQNWASVNVSAPDDFSHASLTFDNYWQSAHMTMTVGELAAVRDAINALLVVAS